MSLIFINNKWLGLWIVLFMGKVLLKMDSQCILCRQEGQVLHHIGADVRMLLILVSGLYLLMAAARGSFTQKQKKYPLGEVAEYCGCLIYVYQNN